jgi:mannan endo-1,4-beta-mannosidase
MRSCVAVLAAAAVLAAGCASQAPPPGPLATRQPAGHPMRYLGVYEPGENLSDAPVAAFGAEVGRQPNIVLYYDNAGEAFPAGLAARIHSAGATPLAEISPRGVTMAAIAAGRDDAWLKSYAAGVAAFGHQVIIGFAPEMNGSWYQWGWHRTPAATWVAAWRHVVTVFRRQGATSVTWLWTISDGGRGPLADYWPGRAWVSWVGVDGYLERPGDTFATAFGPVITAVRKITSAPVLLSETAIGPQAGQAAKIPGLLAGIQADRLLGLVWFDKAQHDGIHHQNWRIESNPAALKAFRAALRRFG